MRTTLILTALAALAVAGTAQGQTAAPRAATPAPAVPAGPPPTPAPAGAVLYFIAPKSGARLTSPVLVQFGLRNMGVTQAGSTAPEAGHHHILIDSTVKLDPEEPLPADRNHLHYGGGQTEASIDLPPGRHTLQLVMGDADHRPFKPSVQSEKITVTIVAPKKKAAKPAPAPKKPRRAAGHTHPAAAPAAAAAPASN